MSVILDARPALHLPPSCLARRCRRSRRSRRKLEGVDSDELADEIVLHVAAHPLDDRDDGDEEHDADHHAEQREEALQLLHADLREREAHRLENGIGVSL